MKNSRGGFSLLELVVAAGALAILTVVVMKVMTLFSRSGESLDRRNINTQLVKTFISRLSKEWKYRYRDGDPLPAYQITPSTLTSVPPCNGILLRQRTPAGGIRTLTVSSSCSDLSPHANPGPAQFDRNIACLPVTSLVPSAGPQEDFPTDGHRKDVLANTICFDQVSPTVVRMTVSNLFVTGGHSTFLSERVLLSTQDRDPGMEYVK